MKTFAAAGILFCFFASFSIAQDASDFGPLLSSRDRSARGARSDSSLFANTGRISGTVVAADGKALFDALVQLRDISSGDTLASASTNTAGAFSFDLLPFGRYEVVVHRNTASTQETVEVRDSFVFLNLRLNASDPNAPLARNGLVSVAEYRVPQRARDAYEKAEKAIAKHRPEEVSRYIQKALEIYPAYAPALTLRGALSLDKNDIAAAVEDFDRAVHADNTYAMAYGAMAAALNRLSKFDEALRAAERASSLAPNSWQAYFEMAKSYVGKADYQRALQQLAHAQGHLAQEYPPLHLLRANVLLGLQNFNDAANELKSFLRIAPNDPNSAAARETLARVNAFIASSTKMTSANTTQ